MKRVFSFLMALSVLAGLGWAGWYGVNRYKQVDSKQVPLAPARFGEFLAIVRCRGELKADRSVQIYVPFVPNLRIAWIAPAGEMVKEGDPVVRYDTTNGQQDLIQREAALRQIQASLDQAKAQGVITSEHDAADIVDAKYQVELAQIKNAGNEFLGRIDAERNRIDLGMAEQKLRQTEASVAQHKVADAAKLASLQRQLDQATAEVELVKRRLANLEMKAPITGYWIVNQFYQGNSSQPFKIGDNVAAGVNLAVIPDMASLMIDVKIEEVDRGRLKTGLDARVRVDAVPELVIPAKLTQISPLAEISLEGAIARNFRGYAALPNPDPRLRPGMNGGMDIVIDRLPNAVSVPAKALFTRAGRPVVYVSKGEGTPVPIEVEVLARNPDEIAVSGIEKDAMVALVDPNAAESKDGKGGAKEPAGGGGK